MKIIADSREKNSLVIASLVELKAEVEMRNLAVADYIVGDVAIERKTVSDFISSMINKRLLRQLEEIKQYKKRMLVIEGMKGSEIYNDRNEGIHANAVRGMILSCVLDYEVPVVMTKNSEDTAAFLNVLAKRFDKKKQDMSLRAKKKAFNIYEQQQIILEGFPGIGPKTAKELLKNFRTLSRIMNAGKEELGKIERFNEAKVDEFLKILNAEYRS